MGREKILLWALVAVLSLSIAHGQDNDTCSADSCGISTCAAGYELEVEIDSDSLMISCNPCNEDYYKSGEGAEACEACPDGLVSEVGATTCSLEEGYWRTSNTSTTAYKCPNFDACIGGSDEASYCEEGFEGPLCAVCTDDYYPSGSYECLECTTANSASTILTIIIFIVVLVLFIVVIIKAAEKMEEKARENGEDKLADNANEAATAKLTSGGSNRGAKVLEFVKKWKDTLLVRFKIIVAHFQVVATFPSVLDVQWPEAFNRYADKVSIVSLDIWGILSQGCYFRSDFLKQLIFTTILPLGIVAVLLALYFRSVRSQTSNPQQRQAAYDRTTGGILLTGFFFYIITSTLVLEAFDCQNFDDGTSYLKADYDMNCDSNRYTFVKWYSIIMVFIFPVGIPLTYLAALYRGRTKINPDPRNPKHGAVVREDDPTIQKTKFLWGTYRPSVYWYECWECVRKLLLTGLLVYFKEGTPTQVVIAMLITLMGLRVLAGLQPYLREDENALAEASLWVTFLTLFVGLLIKAEVATDDGYDEVALGVVLSFMNMAIVGLAGFQLVWTTSMWFREKLGWTDEENEDEAGIKTTEQRRRSAPTTMERPRSTTRPVVQSRPISQRPPEQHRPVQSPVPKSPAMATPRVMQQQRQPVRMLPADAGPVVRQQPHPVVHPVEQRQPVRVPPASARPMVQKQLHPVLNPVEQRQPVEVPPAEVKPRPTERPDSNAHVTPARESHSARSGPTQPATIVAPSASAAHQPELQSGPIRRSQDHGRSAKHAEKRVERSVTNPRPQDQGRSPTQAEQKVERSSTNPRSQDHGTSRRPVHVDEGGQRSGLTPRAQDRGMSPMHARQPVQRSSSSNPSSVDLPRDLDEEWRSASDGALLNTPLGDGQVPRSTSQI